MKGTLTYGWHSIPFIRLFFIYIDGVCLKVWLLDVKGRGYSALFVDINIDIQRRDHCSLQTYTIHVAIEGHEEQHHNVFPGGGIQNLNTTSGRIPKAALSLRRFGLIGSDLLHQSLRQESCSHLLQTIIRGNCVRYIYAIFSDILHFIRV